MQKKLAECYVINTVIFGIMQLFLGVFQAFLLTGGCYHTPPQPTAIYGGYLLSNFFIFIFFKFFISEPIGWC